MIEAELRSSDLLALFTDSVLDREHRRIPHTRSVYITKEKESVVEGSSALLLIDNLPFTLHVATPVGELDQAQLLEEMIRSYCSKYYSVKSQTALVNEIHSRSRALESRYPGLEKQWLQTELKWHSSSLVTKAVTVDEALRVYLSTIESNTAIVEANFPAILSRYRENQVARVRLENLDANISLYKEYRQLLKKEEDIYLVRKEMKADSFFFIKSLIEVPVEKSWALASKLDKCLVWCVTLDNHLILEHFLEHFRRPLEIGGQFYPTRIEGKKVPVRVLAMDPTGTQPHFYERGRNTVAHDFSLNQTLAFRGRTESILWSFPSHKKQLSLGTIEPGTLCDIASDAPIASFEGLCLGAQKNVGHLSSNRLTVQLGQLQSVVLLLDYATVTKSEEKTTVVSFIDILDRVPVKKVPETGRKKVSLKRTTEEEVQQTAAKKSKYMGKDAPKRLRQSSLSFVVEKK